MRRIAAVACGVLVACSSAWALGADDKKPVRKPVINLDGSVKQRRPGQVMPGDTSPASATPAKPAETTPPPAPPKPQTPPPPTPTPAPQPQPQAQPAPVAQQPQPPIATPERPKAVLPPPKLHVGVIGIASSPAANAQARRLGAVGPTGTPTESPWIELAPSWSDEAPIEVRVGVHAPVVIRITGVTDASGAALTPTLVTLWPMARAMVGPELVDGRWIAGVRLTRGQVTVQPDAAADIAASESASTPWSSVVRTPDRAVPVAGAGGRVAYDPVRGARHWQLLSD